MELDDIKRLAKAARQIGVKAGPGAFTLQVPTKLQISIAYMEAGGGGTLRGATLLRYWRALLLLAVVGWSGVPLSAVLEGQPDTDDLPYSPDAVELLLDAQPEWEQLLTDTLIDALNKRRGVEDTAAKN
jgi:hypothetical protein